MKSKTIEKTVVKIVSLLLHFLGKPVLVTIPSPSCIHPVNVTWFVVLTVLSIEERGDGGGGRVGGREGWQLGFLVRC